MSNLFDSKPASGDDLFALRQDQYEKARQDAKMFEQVLDSPAFAHWREYCEEWIAANTPKNEPIFTSEALAQHNYSVGQCDGVRLAIELPKFLKEQAEAAKQSMTQEFRNADPT